jgi:hypothetical protein
MDERDWTDAEHLNRLWDSLVDVPNERDGEWAEAIAALLALDDAPEPDPVFLARLRGGLVDDREPAVRAPKSERSLGLVAPAPTVLPPRALIRLAVAAIAAALLVAALSGGGRWLSGSGPAPMIASAMASSVSDRPTTVPTTAGSPAGIRRPHESTGFQPTVVPGLSLGDPAHLPRVRTQ